MYTCVVVILLFYSNVLLFLSFQAPSLLITLINMFLQFGSTPQITDDDEETTYSVFSPSEGAADFQVNSS